MATGCRCPPLSVPALANQRVEALGKLLEELAEAGALGRQPDLVLARVGPRVGDVVGERRREQERVVRDHGHPRRSEAGSRSRHVDAVDEHGALVNVV